MRTFAVGDIHGCLAKLEDLLQLIDPQADDLLIFLGDYIDRGPASDRVIECLLDLSQHIRCIFLKGNHEDMLLNFLGIGLDDRLYLANGGTATVECYLGPAVFPFSRRKFRSAIPRSHLDFLADLRPFFEDDRYIYVHAGIKPHLPLSQQDMHTLLWTRFEFMEQPTGLKKKVIFGHTHLPEPFVREDKIGIDTGAVYGGPLTAIELPQERFWQSRGQGSCL